MRDVVVGHSSCWVGHAPMHSFSVDVVFSLCRTDSLDDGDRHRLSKSACCPISAVSHFSRDILVSLFGRAVCFR